MLGIKKARKLIASEPNTLASKTLSNLVYSLESDEKFNLSELYKLDIKTFSLAMDILQEWRLDRYYAGKSKLFDLAYQHKVLQSSLKSS